MMIGAMTIGTGTAGNETCEYDEAFYRGSSSVGVPMSLMLLMIVITFIVGMLCGCVLSRAMRGTPVSVTVSGPSVTVNEKNDKTEKTEKDEKIESPIPAPRTARPPRPQERQRDYYRRSVLTQSMVTYKRKWLQQRFQPLGQDDHGAWSD